jgi:hypothetical protein
MKPTTTKKSRPWILTGWGLIVVFILIGAGLYLYFGWLGYQESAKIVEVQARAPHFQDPYTISPAQEEKLLSYGYPEAFTILFYEEELLGGGTQTIRQETWDYYTQRVGLTFINGDLIAEDPIDISLSGPIDPLPYFPEQFGAYMSLYEVISAAAIDSYVEIPVEDDFIADGVLYYANSLSFGLKDDQLIYIESIALTGE